MTVRLQRESIRVLGFDLDDTLWPIWPVIERAERALHAWLIRRHPELAGLGDRALSRYRDDVIAQYPERSHDFSFLRREAIRAMLVDAGLSTDAVDEATAVFFRHRNQVACFDDVVPVLSSLRERYTLVSLSNGNADLDVTVLRGVFHRSYNAAGVGHLKPAPQMFERALEESGSAPHEMLHVGDDPHSDMEGARRAGVACAWLNRDGRPWPADLEPPDVVIRSLFELQELMAA